MSCSLPPCSALARFSSSSWNWLWDRSNSGLLITWQDPGWHLHNKPITNLLSAQLAIHVWGCFSFICSIINVFILLYPHALTGSGCCFPGMTQEGLFPCAASCSWQSHWCGCSHSTSSSMNPSGCAGGIFTPLHNLFQPQLIFPTSSRIFHCVETLETLLRSSFP